MVGEGTVNHNSRKFHAENTDPKRSHLNAEYCNENIKDVYHELFDEALARYNAKQSRKDRRIDNYYEKIDASKQEKTFHEIILQVGNKDNMNATTENGRLAALGFKGGTRSDTEWNQWVASEKRQLAAVMERHGIEWEQKGTHEKHLSVLDFEKKERTKEVAALEARKADLQEENVAFEEINENLHEQLQQIDDEIHSLQDDLKQSQQEADKAKKQADKYQKRMNELAPMVNNMERLAAEFSANPEETLPEVAVMESAKSY